MEISRSTKTLRLSGPVIVNAELAGGEPNPDSPPLEAEPDWQAVMHLLYSALPGPSGKQPASQSAAAGAANPIASEAKTNTESVRPT